MAERRRGGFGWVVGILVVLGLLWTGYWYAAHYFAEAAIARITAAHASGRTVACGEIALGGFPLRLDLRCSRGAYAEAGDRATAAVGGLAASAPLYRPGTVEARLDGPLTLNAPADGIALTATWTSGTASGGAWLDGLNAGGVSFTGLKAENSGTGPELPLSGLTADAASASFAPAGGGSYAVAADAKHLALARPNGIAIPVFDGTLRATALELGALGTDPTRAVLKWLRGTPHIHIDRLRLAAAGAIVTASGDLSLSSSGLLSGSILLGYNSVEGLASLIEALKPGTRDKYQPALEGLRAMSKRVTGEDGPALQTTLTFTDGLIWLTIIPLPIDPIPPIRF
jgi:hypothetical protein